MTNWYVRVAQGTINGQVRKNRGPFGYFRSAKVNQQEQFSRLTILIAAVVASRPVVRLRRSALQASPNSLIIANTMAIIRPGLMWLWMGTTPSTLSPSRTPVLIDASQAFKLLSTLSLFGCPLTPDNGLSNFYWFRCRFSHLLYRSTG